MVQQASIVDETKADHNGRRQPDGEISGESDIAETSTSTSSTRTAANTSCEASSKSSRISFFPWPRKTDVLDVTRILLGQKLESEAIHPRSSQPLERAMFASILSQATLVAVVLEGPQERHQ